MKIEKAPFLNRELSWLTFNERVLQEAADQHVPLLERLKFLGIFSSNLDEFFRVRVANNRRLLKLAGTLKVLEAKDLQKLLIQIQETVLHQQQKHHHIYTDEILPELNRNGIFIVNENELNAEQSALVSEYFFDTVAGRIFPFMLDAARALPDLRDGSIYLAVKMQKKGNSKDRKYALVPIPTGILPRFYIIPEKGKKTHIILLDDVIRANIHEIFSNLDYDIFSAFTVKITRDAELELDNEVGMGVMEKMKKSLEKRKKGEPVRLIFDEAIPADLLTFLVNKLNIKKEGLIPGKRYHNFRDFIKFPAVGPPELRYESLEPIPLPDFDNARSMVQVIGQKDVLVSHPYQSFDYVARFLREAAIDPEVTDIRMTIYRIAENSNVANALINAVKNGKRVKVVVELFARFDEEHNLYWTDKLRDAGVEVIFGPAKMKVHAKMCLIGRRENGKTVLYGHLGTGNYNDQTAKLYCDHAIFTANQSLLREALRLFEMIRSWPVGNKKFEKLLVAPVNMKKELLKKIDREIGHVKKGKQGFIILKTNNLVDTDIIAKLYEASRKGVQIRLICRSICSLVPGVKKWSENIEGISIVDRLLEHSRVYYFSNGGKEELYMGSADLMTRNLEFRFEMLYPVLDKNISEIIKHMLELQLGDNTKARVLDGETCTAYKFHPGKPVQAQLQFYRYLFDQSGFK